MGTTANLGLPYPEASDPPAGHTQIQALAEAVDTQMGKASQRVQSGTVTATFSNQAAVSVGITFSPAFAAPPNVVATGDNRYRNVSIDNVTATGCSVRAQSDNSDTPVSGSMQIDWIAVGAVS